MRWICRRQGSSGLCGFGEPDGALRNAMAHGAREPFCSCQGQWIDHVRGRRPSRGIVLDMDSSVSPTHGERENSVWNGHYACTRYHPLFVFNQFGDLEHCALRLRAGNVHSIALGRCRGRRHVWLGSRSLKAPTATREGSLVLADGPGRKAALARRARTNPLADRGGPYIREGQPRGSARVRGHRSRAARKPLAK